MQFDTSKIPNKQWLTLCEAMTWHAFGEALDRNDAYCFPAERAARNRETPPADAARLIDEQARKLDEAGRAISDALEAGALVIKGEREGRYETIEPTIFHGSPTLQWTLDMVTAQTDRWGRHAGRNLEWAAVRVERASLVQWLHAQRGAATAAQAATRPLREKKKRGRPSKITAECEPAARQIAVNMKASQANFGKTGTNMIDAFRTWYGHKYPNEIKPAPSTVRGWFTMWGL